MNFLAGVVTGPGRVRLDGAEIECPALDGLSQGAAVTICIRPEDVAVRLSGGGMSNVVQARIDGLEFTGPFLRATLGPKGGAGQTLIADFSAKAVRDLNLPDGINLPVAPPGPHITGIRTG